MIVQFITNPTFQTPPNNLIPHIANSMQTILTNKISMRPQQPDCYICPPLFVASAYPRNYASNKCKLLLVPCGPQPV